MTEGIHIPREVADREGVPDDLDAGMVGPYRFPDPRRRRVAGYIYAAGAIATGAGSLGEPGWWVITGLFAVLALLHLVTAWPLGIDQQTALDHAAGAVGFPVGHASAAVTFHGWRARPRWQVIVYSADEPPTARALVELDSASGELVSDPYTEDIPKP